MRCENFHGLSMNFRETTFVVRLTFRFLLVGSDYVLLSSGVVKVKLLATHHRVTSSHFVVVK